MANKGKKRLRDRETVTVVMKSSTNLFGTSPATGLPPPPPHQQRTSGHHCYCPIRSRPCAARGDCIIGCRCGFNLRATGV